MNRKWKVAILILGIAIVAFFIWWFNPYHGFPSAYTKVVVPLNNIGDYVHDGTDIWTRYVFTWGSSYLHLQNANITDVFYVDSVSIVKLLAHTLIGIPNPILRVVILYTKWVQNPQYMVV